jgi:replicative DNA helicase
MVEYKEPLSYKTAIAAADAVLKKKGKESLLRLACYPNSTISIAGVRAALESWSRRGWTPDVVVIDYADILAPLPGYAESRDSTNATWQQMRALSQQLHGLVITATQTKATSYTAELMEMQHFSEDKRKFAHVTGALGINETADEKRNQTFRLNWLVLRESDFSTRDCVTIAGCRDVARPIVLSTW